MNRSFLAILFSPLFFISNSLAQWEILNEGTIGYPITMDFVSEDVGWILRSEGEMLKTIDGGQTWTTLPTEEQLGLRMIDFLNDSVGWSIGSDNVIYKTENGGKHWTAKKIPTPQDWWSYSSIQVLDESHVFIAGDIKIFKTTDGGTSWVNLSPSGIEKIYYQINFLTPQVGMVFGIVANTGSMIIRTTNGGSSWMQQSYYEYGGFNNLQFINDSLGYFTSTIRSTVPDQPDENILMETNNMGLNWKVKAKCPFRIGPCQFINNDTIYIVIPPLGVGRGVIGSDSLRNHIMKSTDGGITWQDQNAKFYFYSQPYAFPAMTLNTIRFNKLNGGLTIGSLDYNSCLIYRTSDYGQNWYPQNFNYPFNDVLFFNDKNGIMLGGVGIPCLHCTAYKGEVFSTNDGGETWKVSYAADGDFRSSSFIDDSNGYCLTENQIYKTTNGGENWISLFENNPDSNGFYWQGSDLALMNEATIYASGVYCDSVCGAMIIGSTDAGKSWKVEFKDPTIQWPGLNSICFADTVGWAVGEQGIIVKYTPNSGWTKKSSITDIPLYKVHFSNGNNVWITGGYQNYTGFQSILLKTSNAGETWETNKNLPYMINDLWFTNYQHGWAVGRDTVSKGVILETNDGGNNWIVVIDKLIGSLNSIFIKDNFAWVVGDNGLILRTTNAGPTWVDDENKTLPNEFALEQNYPNPFNPSTKIKYTIPTSPLNPSPYQEEGNRERLVTLKVYDVLGREVTTIVNEEKHAGIYEVEFNGASLSSGIYLLRLNAGDFNAVKKMLLLK